MQLICPQIQLVTALNQSPTRSEAGLAGKSASVFRADLSSTPVRLGPKQQPFAPVENVHFLPVYRPLISRTLDTKRDDPAYEQKRPFSSLKGSNSCYTEQKRQCTYTVFKPCKEKA